MPTKQIQYVSTSDGSNLFADECTNLELIHQPGTLIYHDGNDYMVDTVDVDEDAVYVYLTKLR